MKILHGLISGGGAQQPIPVIRQQPVRPIQKLVEGVYAEAQYEKDDDTYADNVLTDNIDETWNSGRMATASDPVELLIDLGSVATYVDALQLMPYQVPTPAVTHHKVFLDDDLIADLHGETRHHTMLPTLEVGRTGRTIRIQTVSSPSWVAWSKVEVYGYRE